MRPDSDTTAQVPRAAAWLGAAGLVPFLAGAAVLWLGPAEPRVAQALAAYGAVILSFMGGCRWGFAAAGLGEGAGWRALTISVVPALVAWGAVMAPGDWPLIVTAGALAALYLADLSLSRAGGAPVWWPRLRLPLTAVAAACLIAGALA